VSWIAAVSRRRLRVPGQQAPWLVVEFHHVLFSIFSTFLCPVSLSI
jgi:hypothetical protein